MWSKKKKTYNLYKPSYLEAREVVSRRLLCRLANIEDRMIIKLVQFLLLRSDRPYSFIYLFYLYFKH